MKPGQFTYVICKKAPHEEEIELRKQGWEIRDCIRWFYTGRAYGIFGSTFRVYSKTVILARRPLEGTVAQTVLKHGTGTINIDGCRVPSHGEKLGGGAEREIQAEKPDGWDRPWRSDPDSQKAHSERIRENVAKAETLGRFPANVLHDGSKEVIRMFPDSVAGKQTKPKGKGGFWTPSSGAPAGPQYGDSGSAARFFYDTSQDGPGIEGLKAYLDRLIGVA